MNKEQVLKSALEHYGEENINLYPEMREENENRKVLYVDGKYAGFSFDTRANEVAMPLMGWGEIKLLGCDIPSDYAIDADAKIWVNGTVCSLEEALQEAMADYKASECIRELLGYKKVENTCVSCGHTHVEWRKP